MQRIGSRPASCLSEDAAGEAAAKEVKEAIRPNATREVFILDDSLDFASLVLDVLLEWKVVEVIRCDSFRRIRGLYIHISHSSLYWHTPLLLAIASPFTPCTARLSLSLTATDRCCEFTDVIT